ncbi:MAG: CCA tRNA nucleotidyltransferase [Clostridiales bacterium]|jgi:tRNA nucleotidyltransferase (CCA-adding enzyme)|nr:CCA tRNA nucleotidyltransferase [Clostridiales bacterium]
MNTTITIPKEAAFLLEQLHRHGWEAYVVGGCVRDSLLGKPPDDWDIATSALPQQTKASLPGIQVLDTGLQHGTVTAIFNNKPFEITTYRTDGIYTDHRRPDQVIFTSSLQKDLARRDFTINALAYHPEQGLLDYFSGLEDLHQKILRCVGSPTQRFQEDALRIFRALRFASTLGFSIEPATAQAALEQKSLLHHIAAERLQAELKKLLCGISCEATLRQFAPVLFEILPELSSMVDCQQHHPYHVYSVWEHTLHAMGAIEPDPILRLTMLLHDSGKPVVKTTDENGIDHFYGHATSSVGIAETALRRLKFDRHTRQRIPLLVKHHDLPLTPTIPWIKRQLNRFGTEVFSQLLSIHQADILAQNPALNHRISMIQECRDLMAEVLEQEQCFSIRHLAVNGHDLLNLGIPTGKEIGRILNQLLEAVMDGTCENTRQSLLDQARQFILVS